LVLGIDVLAIGLERLEAGPMIFIGPLPILVLREAAFVRRFRHGNLTLRTSRIIAALRCAVQRSIGSGCETEVFSAMGHLAGEYFANGVSSSGWGQINTEGVVAVTR
jgi:hypothetical protein